MADVIIIWIPFSLDKRFPAPFIFTFFTQMGKTTQQVPLPNNTRRAEDKNKVSTSSCNDYEYIQEHPEHPLHKCSLV